MKAQVISWAGKYSLAVESIQQGQMLLDKLGEFERVEIEQIIVHTQAIIPAELDTEAINLQN